MGIIKFFHKRSVYHRTVNSLSRLSEKELKDIGISRGEITYVARSIMNKVK